MAIKVTLTKLLLVSCLALQLTTCTSFADESTDWDETVNAIIHGIDWVADSMDKMNLLTSPVKPKEAKALTNDLTMGESYEIESPREPRLLDAESHKPKAISEDNADDQESKGRLFFGTGTDGTTVTLNLQAIQSAVGAILFVGVSFLLVLLLVSLITGRDINWLTNGIANRFTSPLSNAWYAPNNQNYYRDESTYTSYRAFEDAAKKYEQEDTYQN